MFRYISLVVVCFSFFSALSLKGQGTSVKQIKFKGEIRVKDQSAPGVKLELKKDGEIIKTVKSSTSGAYEILIDVNSTDESDADYVLTFTKNKMLPKTVSINTYIEKPTAQSYIFNLDVDMVEQKADDIVIDLPSANVRWSENDRKFIFDQTHAKTIKKVKEKVLKEDSLKTVSNKNAGTEKPIVNKIETKQRQKSEGPVDIPTGSMLDEERKKEIQDSLVKTYQKGITEEVFEESNYVLTKRTVIRDNKATIYYKKVWSWGGVFYFKEEQSIVRSISENTYNAETIGVK